MRKVIFPVHLEGFSTDQDTGFYSEGESRTEGIHNLEASGKNPLNFKLRHLFL